MSFVRSRSPPPPMPSPELRPTPLPSPPPFNRKQSRSKLAIPGNQSPPIPASPIGSPLIQHPLRNCRSTERFDRRAQENLFREDDEFGIRKAGKERRRISTSSSSHSIPSPARSINPVKRASHSSPFRSPPPSPAIASPPPPVPPIPAFVLAPTDKKPVLRSSPKQSPHTSIIDLYVEGNSDIRLKVSKPRFAPTSRSEGAVTCMQFFALHNTPSRDCKT